jgi:hypothetical protein
MVGCCAEFATQNLQPATTTNTSQITKGKYAIN